MAASGGSNIFSRFTERSRQVIVLGQEEARKFAHNYIGTEHILLGISLADGLGKAALQSLGVESDIIRNRIEELVGWGRESPIGQIPFTPRAKKIVEYGLREALSLGHNYIGTEHLLLGLVRESEGVAIRILADLGLDEDNIRNAVIRALSSPRPKVKASEETEPHEDPSREPQKSTLDPTEPPSEPAQKLERGQEEEPAANEVEAIEAVPTHHDGPATQDELGRARLASVLAERIRRVRGEDTATPIDTLRERRRKLADDKAAASRSGGFMVHIHAPWGAGKSSLLNFLGIELRNRPEKRTWPKRLADLAAQRRPADPSLSQWIVVEFSAWQHQRLVAPWWWLLSAMQRACARELWQVNRGRWLWFEVRDFAWRTWNARAAAIATLLLLLLCALAWKLDWFGLSDKSLAVVSAALLTSATAIALASTIVGLIRGTSRWLAVGSADGAVRFLKRAHDPLGAYRRRFRWLVRSSGRPIAVFIDDLDRCRPEYVVELLEGIQTLFADEPVTYVIAADREWLCGSFAGAYRELESAVGSPGRPLGFLFLEKTFQISLEIPPMSHKQRNSYWNGLMRGTSSNSTKRMPAQKDLAATFAHASTQGDVEDGIRSLDKEGNDYEDVLLAAVRRLNAPDMQEQLESLLSEFAPMVEGNPRSMKRLLNAYGIERDRLLRDGYLLTKTERRQLALLTILRLRWPLFADHLRSTPEDAKFCELGFDAPDNHPQAELFKDRAVRSLFNGGQLSECLKGNVFERFPDREPDQAI